jgi:hypothetical protein
MLALQVALASNPWWQMRWDPLGGTWSRKRLMSARPAPAGFVPGGRSDQVSSARPNRGEALSRSRGAAPFRAGSRIGIVKCQRLAVAHNLLPADKDMPHGALAGGVDHAADRIVKRLHRRMGNIDHHEVVFGARRPRSSRPNARAPPMVAAVKMSAAVTAWALPPAIRARIAVVRRSSVQVST